MGRGSEALEPGSSAPHPLPSHFQVEPELINQAGGTWDFRHCRLTCASTPETRACLPQLTMYLSGVKV